MEREIEAVMGDFECGGPSKMGLSLRFWRRP